LSKTSTLSNGEELVIVPGGPRPKTLCHKVPVGGKLDLDENKKIIHVDDKGVVTKFPEPSKEALEWLAEKQKSLPAPTVGDGWQAFVDSNTSPIGYFTHSYTVPAVPTSSDGQTLFFFGYIASSHVSMNTLFQPVLQWGPSSAGGGNYWAIACWYLLSGTLYYTSATSVSAGDSLTGVVSASFFRGASIYVTVTLNDTTSGANQSLTTPGYAYPSVVPDQIYAGFSLETYGVISNNDFSSTNTVTLTNGGLKGYTGSYLTTNWQDNNWNNGVTATFNNNNNPGAQLTIHTPSFR